MTFNLKHLLNLLHMQHSLQTVIQNMFTGLHGPGSCPKPNVNTRPTLMWPTRCFVGIIKYYIPYS